MITFKQLKQKLMTDLKQRIVKNYSYDKKAEDDIHYHLNFGKKNTKTKKSKDEVIIEMMLQIKCDILHQMNQGFKQVNDRINELELRVDKLEIKVDEGFKQVNERVDKLEIKVDEGFKQVNTRLDQLENQAIAHGWNIKKI